MCFSHQLLLMRQWIKGNVIYVPHYPIKYVNDVEISIVLLNVRLKTGEGINQCVFQCRKLFCNINGGYIPSMGRKTDSKFLHFLAASGLKNVWLKFHVCPYLKKWRC